MAASGGHREASPHLWAGAFFVLALVLHPASTLPTPFECPAVECTVQRDICSYTEQNTYTYKLEASSETSLSAANLGGKDAGKLQMTAVVELQAISSCQFGLYVKNVQVTGSDAKKHKGLRALEGKPVQLSLQNGRLEPVFCSDPSEEIAALNLKRAVASLLQVITRSQTQTDVFGDCPVDVTLTQGSDGVTIVNSHRDLNKCQRRENLQAGLPSTSYIFSSESQSVPLLQASARLQQKVKGGVLESANSQEEYMYKPFAKQNSGAHVTVHTTLMLTGTKPKVNFKVPVGAKVHSVVFEAPHSLGTENSNEQNVVKALQAAGEASPGHAGPDAARAVKQLVQILRQTNKDDILKVFNTAKSGAGFKGNPEHMSKLFVDALMQTSTGESIDAVLTLKTKKEIEDSRMMLFYSSLAFTHHATLSSLTAIYNILDQPNTPREGILGAGSLVGAYLSQHGHGQQNAKEVLQLLNRIARSLGNCQPKNFEQENKVLTALKALHNAHYIPDPSVADKIKECAANKKGSTRVRSAALDTMQSDAANKKLKQVAYDILGDTDEDSELRIKAYLVLVTCPCGNVATFVKELLDKEPVNQVGSFISTHLRNLRASSSPEKAAARRYLANIRVPGKFNLDTRKYSSNLEMSYALGGEANAAASAEANIIFSQNSFLPRSASLNLTADVFGHSFNFIEVGARAENLEHLLESYFGPKGYFKTHSPDEVMTTGKESLNMLAEKIKSRARDSLSRNRRSVARGDLDKMAAKVQLPGHEDDSVNLDLYLKLFGAELAFFAYHGDPEAFTPTALVDKLFDAVDESIRHAKDFKFDIKKNARFLDAELIYPTASGFPLRLSSVGTAVVNIHLAGKLDLPALVKDPKNANLKFDFMPSVAVDVSSDLQVDFYATSAGLKHAATLQSSTGVDLTLTLKDGKSFDFDIGTPLDKQEIFTLKSELFVTNRDRGHIQTDTALTFQPPGHEVRSCFDQLAGILDVTLCYELVHPVDTQSKETRPFFPLNGLYQMAVQVVKQDSSLTKYRLHFNFDDSDNDRRTVQFTYSTPGSKSDITMSLALEFIKAPHLEVSARLKTPIFSGAIIGKLINNDKERKLYGRAEQNDKFYEVSVGLQVQGDKKHAVYTPVISFISETGDQSSKDYSVTGTITVDQNEATHKFEMTVTSLCVTLPRGKYQLDGHVFREEHKPFELDLKYKYDNLAQYVALKAGLREDQSIKTSYSHIEIESSQFPDFSFAIRLEAVNDGPNKKDVKLKLHHGTDLTSESNCLSLSSMYNYNKEGDRSFVTKNSVSYPAIKLAGHFEMDITKKSVRLNMDCGMDAQKVSTDLSFKHSIPGPEGQQNPKDPGGYEFNLKLGAGGQTVAVDSRRQIVTVDTSKLHFGLEVQPKGKTLSVDSDVTHRMVKNDLKLKLTSVFKMTGIPDTYTLCTGLTSNLQNCEGHIELSKGNDAFFLIKADGTKGETQVGSLKLLLKGYLEGEGSYSYAKASKEGNLKLDLFSAKLARKLKLASDIKTGAKPTTSVLTVDLLLDADKDDSRKIHLDTTFDLAKDGRTFDSRSNVVVLDKKFDLQLKGVTPCRSPTEKGVHVSYDAKLTLPSAQVLTSAGSLMQLQSGEGSHGLKAAFKFNDGKGSKLDYEGLYSRVTALTVPTYDVTSKLHLVAPGKKDVALQMSVEHRLVEDKHCIDYKVDVTGSLVPHPFHTTFSTEFLETPRYILHATYGDKTSADIVTSFSGFSKTVGTKNADFSMDLKTSIEGYEHIKYKHVGTAVIENNHYKYDAKETLEVNDVRKYDIHADTEYTHEPGHSKGHAKVTMLLGADTEPRVFETSHEYMGVSLLSRTNDSPASFVTRASVSQGSAKFGSELTASWRKDENKGGTIGFKVSTPIATYEDISFLIDYKGSDNYKHLEADMKLQVGETRKYDLHGLIENSEIRRIASFKVQRPGQANPVVKVHSSINRATFKELSGEISMQIGEAKPRSFSAEGYAKYPGGVEDFELAVTLDSETLKLNKVKITAANQVGAKGGRKIAVSAKSADKTYFEGSTSFNRKEEGHSLVYEGRGKFKVGDESRDSNFRFVSKQLTIDEDKETGFDVKLTAELSGSAGKQNLELQHILSDKTLKVFTKACDIDAKCAFFELTSQIKASDITEVQLYHVLALDLEKYTGFPSFVLRDTFMRKKFDFEIKMDATLSHHGHESKYIFHSFLKDLATGLHLTLPQRLIALDAKLVTLEDSPKGKTTDSRSYKYEVTFGLDKIRQPEQILKIVTTLDYKKGKDGVIYNSELKATHPLFAKPIVVKSRTLFGTDQTTIDSSVTLDLFAREGQAILMAFKNERLPVNGGYNITSTFTIVSKGQNLDLTLATHAVSTKTEVGLGAVAIIKDKKLPTLESGVQVLVGLTDMFAVVRSPSCDLLRLEGHIKTSTDDKAILKKDFTATLTVIDTLVFETNTHGLRRFDIHAFDKGHPEERVVLSGDLDPEHKLELKQVRMPGDKKLFYVSVPLDKEHFLQIDYSVDQEEIKVTQTKVQEVGKVATNKLTSLVADATKDASTRAKAALESLKRSKPDFDALVTRIKEQYEAIQKELDEDATVQELVQMVRNLVGGLAKAVAKTVEVLTNHYNTAATKMSEFTAKFSELTSKLGPVFAEAAGKISRAFAAVLSTALEISTNVSAKVIEVIKEHSEEIRKVIALVADFIKEQSRAVAKAMSEIREVLEEFLRVAIEQIRAVPFLDNIRDRYKELYDNFLNRFEGVFLEVAETVKEVMPTPELKELLDTIIKYVTKKIRLEPVNELAEFELILQQIVKAARALAQQVTSTAPPGVPANFNLASLFKISTSPASLNALFSLPKLMSVRLSLLDLLASDDLPSAADLFFTYTMPRNFDDLFPPHQALGQISASQHFFTFDGNHFTLKGDCQYLLARDFDDGNFSLVVDLAGGKLQSVSYIDHKDAVEIRADHTVLLNGQATELPVHHDDIALFRTLHSVHLKSKAGVHVSCDLHLDLCTFAVNGYYFGKTRGLLGTISNEKYDDLALPNGKIATTVPQFANSYKLSESCVNQAPAEHTHTSHPECIEAFSSQSSLSSCFKFVDPTPYRHACDDAKDDAKDAEGTTKSICDASAAYVTRCRQATFLRPSLPNVCASCSAGELHPSVGSSFTMKAPSGKADILIIVEQLAENEEAYNEFLAPLAETLTNDLKDRGVSDTHISMIGYGGPNQYWPSLFTSNGKFQYDGKRPSQLTFGKKPAEPEKQTEGKRNSVLDFVNKIRSFSALETGTTEFGRAFEQVLKYPFRADAAKGVFLLRYSPCHKSPLLISLQQLQMLAAREFFRNQGIVVAFFQPLAVTAPADKKLAGFDSNVAFTLKDTKKGSEGDAVLRSEIDYSADTCSSFIDLVQPTVFSMKTFKEMKGNQRKNVVQVASSRLSSLLAGQELTLACDCRLHEGLHAEPRCSVTSTKDKAGGQKKGVKS